MDAGSQLWRRPIREVFEERARAKELSPSTGENPVGSVPTQQEDRLPELVAEPDQISDGQRWSLAEPEEPKKVRSPSAGLLSWGTFSFRGTPYQVQMDENALAHITKRHGSEFSRFNRDIGSVIESITRTMLPGHAARDDVKLFAERFGNRVELVAEAQLPLSSARRGKETVRIILTPTGETAPLRGTDRRATVMTPVTAYVVGAKSERIETINSWRATKYSVADPDLYARARDVMFAREGSSGLIDTIVRKLFGAVEGESWRKAFVRNMVNRFSPAFELDMAAHNNQLPNVAHSVFKSAELAGAIESRVAQIIKVGPVMIDPATGEIRLVPGGRGLEAILGQVGHADLKDFHAYGIARRELEVRAAIRAGRKKGTKESFSSLSDAELQGIIDAAPENFRNAFAELQELNRHMLNFAVDTGLVSREKADEFASMDYLPYYRVLEDETGSGEPTVLGPANRSGLNNPRSALSVRLKGGDGAIGDLVENLVRNMQSILGASMKNYAAQRAGMAIDKLRAMGDNSYGERVASGDGKHIMRYYINGKPVYYRIDDAPFWAMLASMRPVQQNALISVGSSFSSVLRIGVTVTPAFMIKNLVRGKVSAFVTTDAPLDPFVKTFRAFIDVLRGHPDAEEMKAMSGFGGYSYGQQARSAAAKASRNLRRAGDGYGVNALQRWKDRFAAMLDKLEDIGEATELAERLVLYRHLRDRGLSVGDAGYEAANLINFGRRGAGNGYLPAGVVSLIPLIPFLNARIQGIYRIFENQKRQRTVAGIPIGVVLRGMLVTAFSAALWALNSDDKRWDDEPLERKMLNDIFYIGDTSFTVPRAFEVGTIFGALPVVLLDAIKKQDGRDVAKAVSFAFMNTFAFNPIPQMVRPAIEVYTNYDFFRGGSLEPLSLQHLQKSDRQTRFTSGAARGIAGMLGLSPIQFDHLVGGYLGSSGDMMLAVADAFLANVGAIPERPAGLFGNPQGAGVIGTILGGRSFARSEDERPSRAVRDFYEMKEAATEMMGSYKEAVLTGRPERAAEIATKAGFGANTALNRLASQIGDINRLSRMIENDPNMSPEEKRAKLAPLAELRKEIASIGVNLGRGLGL